MMSSLWFQSDIYFQATAAVRGSSPSSSKEMSSSSPQAPMAYEIPACPLSSSEGNMGCLKLWLLSLVKWNQSVKRFCFHGWKSGRWKPYPEIWNTWLSFCPIVSSECTAALFWRNHVCRRGRIKLHYLNESLAIWPRLSSKKRSKTVGKLSDFMYAIPFIYEQLNYR